MGFCDLGVDGVGEEIGFMDGSRSCAVALVQLREIARVRMAKRANLQSMPPCLVPALPA